MIMRNRTIRTLLLVCFFSVAGISLLACGKDDKDAASQSSVASADEASSELDGKIPKGIVVYGVDVGGISAEEARAKIQSALDSNNAIANSSIQLQHNGQSWALTGTELGITYNMDAALQQAMQYANADKAERQRIEEQGLSIPIQSQLSPTSVDAALSKIASEINQDSVNAQAEFTPEKSDRFTYTAGQNGVELDIAATTQQIQSAFSAASGNIPFNTTVQMVVNTTEPSKTLDDVKKNTQRIASFSTSFKGNDSSGRVHNLKKGVEKLHGVMIKPGREFSFNDTTGARTEKNGWEKAATIVYGNTFEDDYGGGICQVSTTLFIAVAKSGLRWTERTHHTFPSSYVPKGLDATVNYGSKDFRFVNNTDYPIYITSTISTSGKEITVAIWGRPLPNGQTIRMRSETVKEFEPKDPELIENDTLRPGKKETIIKERKGYRVEVYRDTYEGDKVVDSDKMYTDEYPAVQGVVAVGSGEGSSSSVDDSRIPDEGDDSSRSRDRDSDRDSDSSDSDSGNDSDSGSDSDSGGDDFDIPEEGA